LSRCSSNDLEYSTQDYFAEVGGRSGIEKGGLIRQDLDQLISVI
jgi:hypothetical protein